MSIRISIFYTLPVFLLTFLPSLFSQTNSIDSLISVYKNDNQDIYQFLDSEPKLVTAKEHRPPYGSDGDYISKPSYEDIFDEIYNLMRESDPHRFKKLS